jgi:hypothetical protein
MKSPGKLFLPNILGGPKNDPISNDIAEDNGNFFKN